MGSLKRMPKVSVCVITYNQEKYIHQCLQSIVDQKVDFYFEVIVGEDCSTDSTRKIVQEFVNKYPNIFRAIFQSVNTGGSENYLDVHNSACGEYIAHIDGDDVMLCGKLQKQVDFLDSNPGCSVVCHGMRVFDSETGKTLSHLRRPLKKSIYNIEDLLLRGFIFAHSSKMYRKSSVINSENVRTGYDFQCHVISALNGDIGYLDEILGEYRKVCGSISASFFYGDNIVSADKERLNNFDATLQIAELSGVSSTIIVKSRANMYFQHAIENLKADNAHAFNKYIELCLECGSVSFAHRIVYIFRGFPLVVSGMLEMRRFFCKLFFR